jgi:hypothetical protein
MAPMVLLIVFVAVIFLALAASITLVTWLTEDRRISRGPWFSAPRIHGRDSEWVSDGQFCVYCASRMCNNPKAHRRLVLVGRRGK